ncbi:MAG: hypothetical protein V1647_01730 [Pseudomonadota bacterium]
MVRFQKIKTVKVGLWLLVAAFALIVLSEYTFSSSKNASFVLDPQQVGSVNSSLLEITQYNKPSPSALSDIKEFFNGKYSDDTYSIKYHNILSILFLVLIPFLMAFIAMFMLRVPIKYIGIMLAVFVFFTLFPLIFL